MPVKRVSDRGPAFNVYTDVAFGNDVFNVIRHAKKAIDHARSGQGPALLEFLTFRRRGHGEHDDASYVSQKARDYWAASDPIKLYEEYLLGKGGLTPAALEAIETECTANCGPLPLQRLSSSETGTGLVFGLPRMSIQQEKRNLTPASSSCDRASRMRSAEGIASSMVVG